MLLQLPFPRAAQQCWVLPAPSGKGSGGFLAFHSHRRGFPSPAVTQNKKQIAKSLTTAWEASAPASKVLQRQEHPGSVCTLQDILHPWYLCPRPATAKPAVPLLYNARTVSRIESDFNFSASQIWGTQPALMASSCVPALLSSPAQTSRHETAVKELLGSSHTEINPLQAPVALYIGTRLTAEGKPGCRRKACCI